MTTVCFTGWQQPHDALSVIARGDAVHASYDIYRDIPKLMETIPPTPTIAIGWSLGAQILVRAVAGGYIKPQKILLLAPSYQFVANENFPHGMKAEEFKDVVTGYRKNPAEMLRGFHMLVADGDMQSKAVIRTLNTTLSIWKNGLFWLEELGRFSCSTLDFIHFPHTIIIHGKEDKVASPEQSRAFARQLPSSQLVLLDKCGHAPHLLNQAALQTFIGCYV